MENKEEPVFFWKATGPFACFSQWYPCLLTGPRKEQCTSAEQFMMLSKADCFDDEETYKEILAATTQAEIKRLGRAVKNFDENEWNIHKCDIVFRGNWRKFQQNPDLRRILLSTGNRLIVEASPNDAIWGIGLNAAEARRTPERLWPGQNLLGKELMKVRQAIKEEEER